MRSEKVPVLLRAEIRAAAAVIRVAELRESSIEHVPGVA